MPRRILPFFGIWGVWLTLVASAVGTTLCLAAPKTPPPLILSPEISSASLNEFSESWMEADTKPEPPLRPEDFLDTPPGRGLSSPTVGQTNFNYSTSNVWIRFRIENGGHAARDWDFVIRPPHITFVEFYQFDSGTRQLLAQDRFTLEYERHEKDAPTFPVHLDPGKKTTIILKLQAPRDLGFELITRQENLSRQLRERMVHGIYYGIAIAMILYNLFIWFSIRERPYAYYILFLFFFALTVGILDGWVPLGRYLTFSALMTVLWASLFTRNLLETKERLPLADTFFRAITFLSALISIIILMPFYPKIAPPFEYLGDMCIVLYVITTFTTSAWLAVAGLRPAKLLTLAWSTMLVLTGIYFLEVYGIIVTPLPPSELIQIGSAFEMILLSFALADRIKTLRMENAVAQEKALKSEQLKKLVHIVCHDLANPLSAILNSVALRKRKGEKGWELIDRAARQQKEILEQVRNLEAIESGKLVFKLQPVSVREALEEMQLIFASQLEEKNVTLDLRYELCNNDAFVVCDPVAFQHTVLSNLISNAIKFSFKDGKITVLAREFEDAVELCVEDRGIGIPKRLHEILFSTTAITSRLGTFGEKGTGFGMPLVHSVLTAMNATIEIESRCIEDGFLDSGTKITLCFPKAQVRVTQEVPETEEVTS